MDTPDLHQRFLSLAAELRPELHRYCARLTGSVFDGEDVVQDTLERADQALQRHETVSALRPWIFRSAHNRALDLLRTRALRAEAPLDVAEDVDDEQPHDPTEALIRQEAIHTALSRFLELPIPQRSTVILKDVLGYPLAEIAAMLDLSVNAVKAHLGRGRARLRALHARPRSTEDAPAFSPETLRYAALFNARDWEALRALLAEDVKLDQSGKALRVGAEVRTFFDGYARTLDTWLKPAWLEGREVLAAFESPHDARPVYWTQLTWREGRIVFIRDHRYVRYAIEGAELILAPSSH